MGKRQATRRRPQGCWGGGGLIEVYTGHLFPPRGWPVSPSVKQKGWHGPGIAGPGPSAAQGSSTRRSRALLCTRASQPTALGSRVGRRSGQFIELSPPAYSGYDTQVYQVTALQSALCPHAPDARGRHSRFTARGLRGPLGAAPAFGSPGDLWEQERGGRAWCECVGGCSAATPSPGRGWGRAG